MREQLKQITDRLIPEGAEEPAPTRLTAMRTAAAEILVAAAVDTAYDRLKRQGDSSDGAAGVLAWAPLLVAPLAAAAHVEHARNPRDETTLALRILNTASVAVGGALFLYGLLDSDSSARRLAPLGLAWAGLLGFAIETQEKDVQREERRLRRRAEVVERLVPRRQPRLDRVVVHV